MPVYKCSNGKYRIGSGKCMYDSKAKADSAYKGYLAQKRKDLKNELIFELDEFKKIDLKISKIKELIKDGTNERI